MKDAHRTVERNPMKIPSFALSPNAGLMIQLVQWVDSHE